MENGIILKISFPLEMYALKESFENAYFQSFKTKLNSTFLKFLTCCENIFEINSAPAYRIFLIMLVKILQARNQKAI